MALVPSPRFDGLEPWCNRIRDFALLEVVTYSKITVCNKRFFSFTQPPHMKPSCLSPLIARSFSFTRSLTLAWYIVWEYDHLFAVLFGTYKTGPLSTFGATASPNYPIPFVLAMNPPPLQVRLDFSPQCAAWPL